MCSSPIESGLDPQLVMEAGYVSEAYWKGYLAGTAYFSSVLFKNQPIDDYQNHPTASSRLPRHACVGSRGDVPIRGVETDGMGVVEKVLPNVGKVVNFLLEWRRDAFGCAESALYFGCAYIGAIMHWEMNPKRSETPFRGWFMNDDEGREIGWFATADEARAAVVARFLAGVPESDGMKVKGNSMAYDASIHEFDPKTGYIVHRDSGDIAGVEPHVPPKTEREEYPKWVLAHESHVVGELAPEWRSFKPRGGEVMILVDDEEEEAAATSEKAKPEPAHDEEALPTTDAEGKPLDKAALERQHAQMKESAARVEAKKASEDGAHQSSDDGRAQFFERAQAERLKQHVEMETAARAKASSTAEKPPVGKVTAQPQEGPSSTLAPPPPPESSPPPFASQPEDGRDYPSAQGGHAPPRPIPAEEVL
jgi:hypothetical protein